MSRIERSLIGLSTRIASSAPASASYFPRKNSRGVEPRTAAPGGVRPFEEVMGLLLSKERLGVFHWCRTARVSAL